MNLPPTREDCERINKVIGIYRTYTVPFPLYRDSGVAVTSGRFLFSDIQYLKDEGYLIQLPVSDLYSINLNKPHLVHEWDKLHNVSNMFEPGELDRRVLEMFNNRASLFMNVVQQQILQQPENADLSYSDVWEMLKHLEKTGCVIFNYEPVGRNLIDIAITDKGKAYLNRLYKQTPVTSAVNNSITYNNTFGDGVIIGGIAQGDAAVNQSRLSIASNKYENASSAPPTNKRTTVDVLKLIAKIIGVAVTGAGVVKGIIELM